MDYIQLSNGVKYYNDKFLHWNTSYERLRKIGDWYWLHLEELSEEKARTEVIDFLNKWLCRTNCNTSSLMHAISRLPNLYKALIDESIESIDLGRMKTVDERQMTNQEIIRKIMNTLLDVRDKFGPVPASKLMHMALPNLFMMWDSGIREKYNLGTSYAPTHSLYYVRFLKLMQIQLTHAITTCSKHFNIDFRGALLKIRKEDSNATLTRIADKYNFALRDGKVDICHECYERWIKTTT